MGGLLYNINNLKNRYLIVTMPKPRTAILKQEKKNDGHSQQNIKSKTMPIPSFSSLRKEVSTQRLQMEANEEIKKLKMMFSQKNEDYKQLKMQDNEKKALLEK